MIGPLRRRLRRERTVLVVLRCECGYAERWPLPFSVHPGRCTCPHCGGQLREPEGDTAASTAWRVAG